MGTVSANASSRLQEATQDSIAGSDIEPPEPVREAKNLKGATKMTNPLARLHRPTAAVAAAVVALNACASLNNKEKGGIIGAAGGAVVGGAIGNANGSTTKGAILGAVVGGAAARWISRPRS